RIIPAGGAEGIDAALPGLDDTGLDAGARGLRRLRLADRRVRPLKVGCRRPQVGIRPKRLADIAVQARIVVEPPPVIRQRQLGHGSLVTGDEGTVGMWRMGERVAGSLELRAHGAAPAGNGALR